MPTRRSHSGSSTGWSRPRISTTRSGKLAGGLRSGPPIALAFTKRAIRRSLDLDRNAEFDYEVFAQVNCIQTEDHHEGVRAFFDEKRAPVFKGR